MSEKSVQKKSNRTIDYPHLVLCEGRDAKKYLIWLLGQCIKENPIFDKFQVWDFGGISELEAELKVIQTTRGFDKTQSLAIIRDAETDWQTAVQSVKNIFAKCGYAVPTGPAIPAKSDNGITTGFVLFPTCDANPSNGTLEDLCLQTLAGEKAASVLQDVDIALKKQVPHCAWYGACVLQDVDTALKNRTGHYPLKQPHKNRLHAYFSFTNDFVGLKIGEASQAKAFTKTNPPVEALKAFLLHMAQ